MVLCGRWCRLSCSSWNNFLPREWIFGFGLVDRRVCDAATTALFVPVFAFVCVRVCLCVCVSSLFSLRVSDFSSAERERENI